MKDAPLRSGPSLSKFATPRMGRVFDRVRLFALLDAEANSAGIWLSAAPGSGKTTAVATWLRRRDPAHHWLQVDAGDSDPATFLQSFDDVLSPAGRRARGRSFTRDDLADPSSWLRRCIQQRMTADAAPFTLVFDNHQMLAAGSPIHAALARLLEELPAGIQWVFISREPPPAAYTRALAGGHLAMIPADAFRFDANETHALARLHDRPESIEHSLSAARGWAAGMTLMLLGAHRGEAPVLEVNGRLFDYFADEVLSHFTDGEQRALSLLAYLPGASATMAREMSGQETAPDLLERLCTQSLFTERREGMGNTYTFHDLFGEFLRGRFERTSSAAEVDDARRRAARLLADARDFDAALLRYREASAWDDAEACIRRCASTLASHGRTTALARHIGALPREVAARLAYWRGYCALDVDPQSALGDMAAAHLAATTAGDRLAAVAGAAMASIALGRIADLDHWIAMLDREPEANATQADVEAELRVLPGLLAMLVYRAPWHPLADVFALRAERLLHADPESGDRLLLGTLAYHLLWRGHVDRLEHLLLRIDALCSGPHAAPTALFRWWSVGIVVKVLLGHHDAAAVDAKGAVALVEAEPLLKNRTASAHLLAMFVALGMIDVEAARAHLVQAARAMPIDAANDVTMYEHQRGMLAFLDGDRAAAVRLMRAAVSSAHEGGFPMREHIALIAHALAAAHAGEHDEAEGVLRQVLSHPFYGIGGWHEWVAGIVAAYAALQRGNDNGTIAWLRVALRVARQCGFRHGPMLFSCADMMARLMAFAIDHQIEPDVARDVVVRNRLRAPDDAGPTWPWAVRIRALGAFEVEVDGKPMASSRKESRRLTELLAMLVASPGPVAVDVIADELWPDADGDAARNALDNALHRLRRMLAGDDRIVLRQGALSLNPERCWSDAKALDELLHRSRPGSSSEAVSRVSAIDALYRGPLLPSIIVPHVLMRREQLEASVRRARQVESLPHL